MKFPRFSDIPLIYKIGCPPAFALLILGCVGAGMLWSQQRQTAVLDGVVAGEAVQNQLAADAQRITQANGALYVLMTHQAAGSSPADSQQALANVLSQVDIVRASLLTLCPDLAAAQRHTLVGVLKDLAVYRGGINVVGSMLGVDFNAASSFLQPFEGIYARMTSTLNQTSASVAATSAARARLSTNEADLTRKLMIALIAATMLAVAAIASVIVIAFRRAVTAICKATEALAAGQKDLNLERLQRGDELGAIVRSLTIFRENQYRIIAMRAEKAEMEALREATRIEQERITCMISALSETNEAILHAETRTKLFQLVCEAAVLGGKFLGVAIAMADPDRTSLRFVAVDGPGEKTLHDASRTISLEGPGGNAMTARAFLSEQPFIINDYRNQAPQETIYGSTILKIGTRSTAAIPLISRGQPIGALVFLSAEPENFTLPFVELLQRLCRNVAFALENFDRATEKEQAEEKIKHLANHDGLTDLPNRTLFSQLLEFSIQSAKRYQRPCAVLFIDLDRFKLINDSLGHGAGDTLLIEMANRLREGVRASDVVARIGGDEFVVLLNEVNDAQHIKTVAASLLSSLGRSMELKGKECRVTASIGVAIYPDHGTDEQTLLKHADTAMYLAKTEGKNGVRLFSDDIKGESIDRLAIEMELRHAVERNEFCLHYQPKLDVRKQQIGGVEALLRWNHPKLGLLQPAQFIPVAEDTDLIFPIGSWVIKTACDQNMAWQRQGFPPISMAVNVSPRQFMDENLLRIIDEALADSGMDPRLLQIEVTESMVMLNIDRAIVVLEAIFSRGVRLAIDDFGTGYSSMSMLKRFPIDTLKIDRSFVRDLPHNSQDKAIAEAIINMGKALGLTIIAEGVETAEQDHFLREHACDEIQGFLFSKPVPADQISDLLEHPSGSAPYRRTTQPPLITTAGPLQKVLSP
jgi:diguanylate cyclase (GGDEF)-like protein